MNVSKYYKYKSVVLDLKRCVSSGISHITLPGDSATTSANNRKVENVVDSAVVR